MWSHAQRYLLVFLMLLLFAFLPFAPVVAGGAIADWFGCKIDEGSVHACIVYGHDIGPTLYASGVIGWLGIATLPLGASLIILEVFVAVAHAVWCAIHKYRSQL